MLACFSVFVAGLFGSGRVTAQFWESHRNYTGCLHGYYGYDQSRLTEDQKLEASGPHINGIIRPAYMAIMDAIRLS
jgi:hypothetical protein